MTFKVGGIKNRFKKPVIFVTTDKLQQSSQRPFIKLMASWVGKQPINIDNPIEIAWDRELTIDKEAYSKYKNCYIKKNGSEDVPFWQAVSNRIKSLHNGSLSNSVNLTNG